MAVTQIEIRGRRTSERDKLPVVYTEYSKRKFGLANGVIWEYDPVGKKIDPYPLLPMERLINGDLVIPMTLYPRILRAFLPEEIGEVVAGLEQAVGRVAEGKSINFGSGPRKALDRIKLQENVYTSLREDPGADILPLVMRFWWGYRLSQGEPVPGYEQILKTAVDMWTTGGADFDSKHEGLDFQLGFGNAMRFLRDFYRHVRIADNNTAYFYDPKIKNLHEETTQIYSPGLLGCGRMSFANEDLQSVARLTRMQIPSKPDLQILITEFGLGRSPKSLDITTFKVHQTAFPKPGQVDLRSDPANFSWQADITGEINYRNSTIVLPVSAQKSHQDMVTFKREAYFSKDFTAQNLLRGLRSFNTRLFYSFSDRDVKNFLNTIYRNKDDVTLFDMLTNEREIEIIRQGVEYLLTTEENISAHIRTEMLAELGTSILWSVLAGGKMMRETGIYKLLKGFSELRDTDIDGVIWDIFETMKNHFDESNLDFDGIEREYQKRLTRPKIDWIDFHEKLNWEIMTDGITYWVAALEKMRMQKGLPVLDPKYSIGSRFCYYFSIIA